MMPLSDFMPLRTTASWPTASSIEYIPHVYGKCTLEPLQYSENRKEFVIADHAINKVITAYRDGAVEQGFILRNEQDSTGHPVSIIELAKPLADNSTLIVQVLGKVSPDTGRVIDHPADILLDILTMTGHTIDASRLSQFRAEYVNWQIAGCLTGGITIRAQIQEMMASIGAAWALTMPCLAMSFPRLTLSTNEAITAFPRSSVSDLQYSTEQSEIYYNLRVDYGREWTKDRKGKSITITVKDADTTQITEKAFPAPWVTDSRTAFEVGSRVLRWTALPIWRCSFDTDLDADNPLMPGDWIDIEYLPNQWQKAVASNLETDWTKGTQKIYVEFPSQEFPDVEIKQQTESFKQSKNALRITYANGIATIIVLDDSEVPIANAIVTLDGNSVKTNKQGEAKFQTQRGLHSISIEAAGYSKLTTEVTI